MNLLIIEPIGDAFGHFGIHTAKLAQQLAIRGHEVTVCTNRLEVSKFLTETPKFRLIEVEGGRLGFEEFERQATTRRGRYWYGYFRNSWKIANAGLELCRRERFDGIYMTDVEFAMAALSLKRHAKHIPPVILQVNASNFSFAEFPGNVVKKTYKTLQREIFRKVIGKEITAFSILGDWHRDRLRRQLRIGEDFPIELIHDGGGKFENQIEKSAARRQLGIDYSGDVFVFLGILRNDKGLEALATQVRFAGTDRKWEELSQLLQDFRNRLSERTLEALGVPLRTTQMDLSPQDPRSPDVRVGRIFDHNWELLSFLIPMSLFKRSVRKDLERKAADTVFMNLSRLASQWEEIVNGSLYALEKEASRRLDTLVGTIERMTNAAAQEAPRIREDLQRLDRLRMEMSYDRNHAPS